MCTCPICVLLAQAMLFFESSEKKKLESTILWHLRYLRKSGTRTDGDPLKCPAPRTCCHRSAPTIFLHSKNKQRREKSTEVPDQDVNDCLPYRTSRKEAGPRITNIRLCLCVCVCLQIVSDWGSATTQPTLIPATHTHTTAPCTLMLLACLLCPHQQTGAPAPSP